ncbi:hypothetical protein A0256_23745 [Mucilaginibacter sp. PAMC 26640]|nr:hypothetical protein A0256_23745 [Mucilaginibacter sp. PAMC 26640]
MLKLHTRREHQQLKKVMSIVVGELLSKKDLLKLLEVFYRFFSPLESIIDPHLAEFGHLEFHHRRKSYALLKDITFLGGHSTITTDNHILPDIVNYLDALGAVYVMEGLTLGGKFFIRAINAKLGLIDQKGLSYFYGYGSETMDKWLIFNKELDWIPEVHFERIVKSANRTFQNLRSLLEFDIKRDRVTSMS